MKVEWPGGRRFAFTILDDTDDATLENVKPVYDCLREHGLRTTKTVWPLDCPEGSSLFFAADTLQRPEYLRFVQELVEQGFELAFHGATMESSERQRTERALDWLGAHFDVAPRLFANHGHNRENLYWGNARFRTRWLRAAMKLLRPGSEGYFSGEEQGSSYFWADLCEARFEYVRNFTFRDLDVLSANPEMPYRLTDTPGVRHWFSTADAPDADSFAARVTPAALDRLEGRGGLCILSTHLGKGYVRDGSLHPVFAKTIEDLSTRSGWYAPTSEILDHLRAQRGAPTLSGPALQRLEIRYLWDQVRARLLGEPTGDAA